MKLDVEMGQRVDQSGRRKREPDDDTCQQVARDDADDGRQVDPEHTPTAFQELSRGGGGGGATPNHDCCQEHSQFKGPVRGAPPRDITSSPAQFGPQNGPHWLRGLFESLMSGRVRCRHCARPGSRPDRPTDRARFVGKVSPAFDLRRHTPKMLRRGVLRGLDKLARPVRRRRRTPYKLASARLKEGACFAYPLGAR